MTRATSFKLKCFVGDGGLYLTIQALNLFTNGHWSWV